MEKINRKRFHSLLLLVVPSNLGKRTGWPGGTKSCQNILIIDFDYQENKSCIKQCASHCSQDHQYLWKETVLIHCSRLFKGTWSDTQGWPGNKKLSISLATNSLLANLNMLEANCDHPSLVVLTITSHMALFAEFPSFLLLSSQKLVHVQASSGKAETLFGWDPGQGLWGIGRYRSLV